MTAVGFMTVYFLMSSSVMSLEFCWARDPTPSVHRACRRPEADVTALECRFLCPRSRSLEPGCRISGDVECGSARARRSVDADADTMPYKMLILPYSSDQFFEALLFAT